MTGLAVDSDQSWIKLRENKTQVHTLDFPGGLVVKSLLANAGDVDSVPGPESPHMIWGS